MAITKLRGVTPTERLLSDLCEKTFLKLWSYPNPFKDDGKELCDLIAVFDDHVLIFFDRESRIFDDASKDTLLTWERWKRAVIDKQIKTAKGAGRYVVSGRSIFLDKARAVLFPIEIPKNAIVHKFVVAHGAKEACAGFSRDNVYGSLAISYGALRDTSPYPFAVDLDRENPVHILDSHNLEIIFNELDTFWDFISFIEEKERAIQQYDCLIYCGEEDLLAHYFNNYDQNENRYRIGSRGADVNGVAIGEGEWKSLIERDEYLQRKTANQVSYFWDEIIQRTSQNVLGGTMLGDADLLKRNNAIREMAREPRFVRRALAEKLIQVIRSFPESDQPLMRQLSYLPSFYKDQGYVFLQVKFPQSNDSEDEYRPVRQEMLQIACGAAKNKLSRLNKIIGIAIYAPKYADRNSEDFVLLDCSEWPKETKEYFEKANEMFGFFETGQVREIRATDFPSVAEPKKGKRKIGRNERCPCGSGRKYKKCCMHVA